MATTMFVRTGKDSKLQATGATAKLSIPRAMRKQIEPLLLENYAFMDSVMFKQRGIEKELFEADHSHELPLTTWYQPTRDEAIDQSLAGTPTLMKPAEERSMFLRFNFCKKKLFNLQKLITKDGLTRETGQLFLDWHRKFEFYREYLTRTNLALVLAMAKRTRLGDVDFAEVVSEGNMALLRAVDKFNVDRGFKFSTYACRAILKAFSRTALKASKYKTRFPVEFEPGLRKIRLGRPQARRGRGRLRGRAQADRRPQPGRPVGRRADRHPSAVQLGAAGRKHDDPGRSRPDHRRY